ncbi:MAG: dihydrofolate reductase [Anaerovoracaceae bacterium]|jgi:dihydrofolate reductase
MKTIVAVDKNWGIGKDGELLVRLPGDMKYFRKTTTGKVVVMGRTTLESLPGGKPLPGRVNIVLTRNPDYEKEGCIICRSKEEAFKVLENYDTEDVFVIGGEDIYRQFIPYCDIHLVTQINAAFDADKYFENLDLREEMIKVKESEPVIENGIEYKYTEYRRK